MVWFDEGQGQLQVQKTMVPEGGMLLVDKPEGLSSFQVVKRIRKILGASKVGHMGTLDPFATGLLMVCINEGTKLVPFLMDEKREYEGVIKLGTETDTFDGTGTVVRTAEIPHLDEQKLQRIKEHFSGEIWQTPPMFSALKHKGVPLYRLARQGQQVERKRRRITVEAFRLALREKDELFFHAVCSRGAYLRSLAADLGQLIGCGAYLMCLRRLACGTFRIEDSVQLDRIRDQWNRGVLKILPLRACIRPGREWTLEEEPLQKLVRGDDRILAGVCGVPEGSEMLKLLDQQGRLVALAKGEAGVWKVQRVFHGL